MTKPAKSPAPTDSDGQLPEGYRHIRKIDAGLPFHCDHPLLGRLTMNDFYKMSREGGARVLLRIVRGRPGVVLVYYEEGRRLRLELLARDSSCPPGYGFPMLLVVEHCVARQEGYGELTLEAINETLAAHYATLGYERHGTPHVDGDEPEWGTLIPMRKILE